MREPSTARVNSWSSLIGWYRRFSEQKNARWIFRGVPNDTWPLRTTLERTLGEFGVNMHEAPRYEKCLLRQFRRQMQKYEIAISGEEDDLACLALMQHHGAPTRLLDWTYSFFVAAYFATERGEDGGKRRRSAIWAIYAELLRQQYYTLLRKVAGPRSVERLKEDQYIRKRSTYKFAIDRDPPVRLVYHGNPFALNERLIIQQGCFLAVGDVSRSFHDNLDALLTSSNYKRHYVKLSITGNTERRKQILAISKG